MSHRELTLIEELENLKSYLHNNRSRVLNTGMIDRLIRKAKFQLEHMDSLAEEVNDLRAANCVLEHDMHIQEQIIIQLTYEKYKDIVDGR